MSGRIKRIRLSTTPKPDAFDVLPDDLVVSILSTLCSSSSSASDFINTLLVCRRFNRLGLNPMTLSRASSSVFSIGAKNWSDSVHRFVKRCVHAGSVEASYFLGMVRFYCLGNRRSGASLMAKAAIKSHAPALYSLAVIKFNGSGGTNTDKDLRAGAALCARAAKCCHVDALRELGHCLKDGYGVPCSIAEGRRLLIQANALEITATVTSSSEWQSHNDNVQLSVLDSGAGNDPSQVSGLGSALLSEYGCVVHKSEPHPANRFLLEWFGLREGLSDSGLGLCSHSGCGRPETRPHEFRRCSACGVVKYCSRGCQAHDWKLRHKGQCTPAEQWGNAVGGNGGPVVVMGGQVEADVMVES